MSPKIIIDYIIIHELCHTIHFNHSKKFWNLVRDFSPNYKEHKLWLKKNFEMFNEPFADYSSIPSYLIYNKISQKTKVAISGDGADEIFGGYQDSFHYLF